MDIYNHIPKFQICNGKPAIRGKRITVNTILEFLSSGDLINETLKKYPGLEQEDISACLKFAADLMSKNYTIRPVA